MLKLKGLSILVPFLIISFNTFPQWYNNPTPFFSYYYDLKLINPAFTGSQAKHTITTQYNTIKGWQSNFGQNSSPFTFYGSYEFRADKLHSGFGAQLMLDEIGIYSYSGTGAMFSHHIVFDENSGLRLGTQVLYQRLSFDFEKLNLKDPNDPLIVGQSEPEKQVNIDFGAAYYSSVFTAGVSVKNVIANEQLNSTYLNALLTRKVKLGSQLILNPSVVYITDFDNHRIDVNATFEVARWILFGAGYRIPGDYDGDLTLNAGINFNNWVQLIVHAYSSEQQRLEAYLNGVVEGMVRVRIPNE